MRLISKSISFSASVLAVSWFQSSVFRSFTRSAMSSAMQFSNPAFLSSFLRSPLSKSLFIKKITSKIGRFCAAVFGWVSIKTSVAAPSQPHFLVLAGWFCCFVSLCGCGGFNPAACLRLDAAGFCVRVAFCRLMGCGSEFFATCSTCFYVEAVGMWM